MEQCLSESKGRLGTIRAVQQAMKSFAPVPNLKTAMRSEYCDLLMRMQETVKQRDPRVFEVFTGQGAGDSASVWSQLLVTQGWMESNATNLLRVTREIYLALPNDPLDLPAANAAFAAKDKKLAAEANNMHYSFAQSILPAFPDAPKVFVRSAQQRRLLEVLLVSLEERNRTGSFPAKLPVTGSMATDLFGSGPLRYTLNAGKLKIYSVGMDGVDNGGTERAFGEEKEFDLVVSFPREPNK
jgi:hypothetical protein